MQRYLMRRSRLEISIEILRACKYPTVKTPLMQKLNLSYNTLQDCLSQLLELNLLELQPDALEYVTSRRGLAFLAQWTQLQAFLKPEKSLDEKWFRMQKS